MTKSEKRKETCTEAKIRLKSFHSSEALKCVIRKTTEAYKKKGMDLKRIESCGKFIYLKFCLSEQKN
ncbi:MAG: hypothetical protein V2J62_00820 [candidate division KSB1 bacterium]|jgi:hypothetical protein|nr:hypothetical protein [candidate division KSB1 bacterium]